MARGSLRRFDVQAKVSLYLSCAAALGMLALFSLVFLRGNFDASLRAIVYSGKGMFGPMVFLLTAATLVLAALGAAMGANSAGQRRNELSGRSWAAFFIGAGAACLTIVVFSAFWFLKMRV